MMKFIFAWFLSAVLVVAPAYAQQTGPAGSVLRIPAAGGSAKMGPIDLASANSTSGLIAGSCLFGASTGKLLNEAATNCYWDATGKALVLGASSANASAKLQLDSTTKGFLVPRMTQTQRDAISTPAQGLQIFNTTSSSLNIYSGTAWGEIGGGGAGDGGVNLIQAQNPAFESGTASWTNSGGTFATASGSDILFGNGSAVWTPSATGQYVRSPLATVTYGLENTPCMAQVYYKGGDSTEVMSVYTAAGVLQSTRTLAASTNRRKFHVPFFCGAQGSQYYFQIESTAAGAKIALDRTHIGELGLQPASPRAVGEIFTMTGSSCPIGSVAADGSTVSRGANFTALNAIYAADGYPYGSGNGTTTMTLPNLNAAYARGSGSQTFAGVPYSATLGATLGDTFQGHYHNQTVYPNIMNYGGIGTATGTYGASTVFGTQIFQTAQSITAPTTDGTSGASRYGGETRPFSVVVKYCVQTQSSGADIYTPETVAWKIDANIVGANASLGTGTVSSYGPITDANLSLTQNQGSASVGIACLNGTASVVGGANCNTQAVSEQIGLTFNAPYQGDFEACTDFTWLGDVGNNTSVGSVSNVFQIVETSATTATSIQDGKGRVYNQLTTLDPSGGSRTQNGRPIRLCGTFSFGSATQRTLRLEYTQGVSGTVNASQVYGDGSGGINGGRDIHWTVRPLGQVVPAPILVDPNALSYSAKTSSYTMQPSDNTIMGDSSSGGVVITLPSAATAGVGKIIRVGKINAAQSQLAVSGNIEGAAKTTYINRKEVISFVSDGTTWQWNSPSYRTESARISCGTSSSVIAQQGTFIDSIGGMSGNRCGVSFPVGFWPSQPRCTASMQTSETTIARSTHITTSQSGFTIGCVYTNGSSLVACPGPDQFDIVCDGPR